MTASHSYRRGLSREVDSDGWVRSIPLNNNFAVVTAGIGSLFYKTNNTER